MVWIYWVLEGKTSTKQIYQAYKYRFFGVTYNEISNKLSKLTNTYKFLKRDKEGKLSKYSLNYPYWFEYIHRAFLKKFISYPLTLDYNNKFLHSDLEKYLRETYHPYPILEVLHNFLIHIARIEIVTPKSQYVGSFNGLKKYKVNQDSLQFELFRDACKQYYQSLLIYLDKKQIAEILKNYKSE